MDAICNYETDYDVIESRLFGDFFSDCLCREVIAFPFAGYSVKESKSDGGDGCVTIPLADIYENDNEYIVRAEMPGVANDGIEVTVNNNVLDIKGKISGNIPESEKLRYSEYDLFDYHRRLTIDNTIDENRLSANLENGMLTVRLPKKEEAKPRKIEVKTIN